MLEKYWEAIDMRTCAKWWFASPNAPTVKRYTKWAINMAAVYDHVDMRTCAEWWATSPNSSLRDRRAELKTFVGDFICLIYMEHFSSGGHHRCSFSAESHCICEQCMIDWLTHHPRSSVKCPYCMQPMEES